MIDNREPMKRMREKKRQTGYRQINVWIKEDKKQELNRMKKILGLSQASAIEFLIDALAARQNYREELLCSVCGGYGCNECKNTGWR